jgi:hypothetical protein
MNIDRRAVVLRLALDMVPVACSCFHAIGDSNIYERTTQLWFVVHENISYCHHRASGARNEGLLSLHFQRDIILMTAYAHTRSAVYPHQR